MPQCPQCNKPLVELSRQCPSCRADLDLLVDYVKGLTGSLGRAEQLTRAGELGQAVWAYLEVLEVDPDNPAARQQVGQVATAVRQFDRTVPSRRWAQGIPVTDTPMGRGRIPWARAVLIGLALVLAFALGFLVGQGFPSEEEKPASAKPDTPLPRNDNQMGKAPAGGP